MDKNVPQLFYTAASAPCRSVLMVAAALKLKLNLKPINLMEGDHLRPTFLRVSPHHTVPTLVDNEFSMFESRAICIYLVEKYGKNDALYPKNAKTRAQINHLIYFDMGTLFKRFYEYFMPLFQGQPPSEQKMNSLKEALGYLDIFLTDRKFAVGTRITIADLILLSTISTFDVVGVDLSAYQHVHNWYENMKNTAPGWDENVKGLEILKQMTSSMAPPKPAESQEEPVAVAAPLVVETPAEPEPEPVQEPEQVHQQESAPAEQDSTWHPAAAQPATTEVEPRAESSETSHHQQVTPLIEVTDSPQSTTEVVTTTTKEVIESEDGVTEVTTEVTETTTTTTEVTKVIHMESEVKTELVNGDTPVVVNGVGKYGNEVVF